MELQFNQSEQQSVKKFFKTKKLDIETQVSIFNQFTIKNRIHINKLLVGNSKEQVFDYFNDPNNFSNEEKKAIIQLKNKILSNNSSNPISLLKKFF